MIFNYLLLYLISFDDILILFMDLKGWRSADFGAGVVALPPDPPLIYMPADLGDWRPGVGGPRTLALPPDPL